MGGQKVLIAVDGSEQSEKATRWYLENLYQPGDTIVLGYVIAEALEPTFGFRPGLAIPQEHWDAMQQKQNDRTDALKEKYIDILKGKNLTIKFICEFGNPGHHLVEMAAREQVDLVVMGTRGLGTVRRTILGSVSDYLIHHAHTPVCIYRDH